MSAVPLEQPSGGSAVWQWGISQQAGFVVLPRVKAACKAQILHFYSAVY